MNQLDLQLVSGREARDAGIERALDSAERKVSGWSDIAYGYLLEYLCHTRRFQVEDFRAWAYRTGLEAPPSERAFGGVILAAKRAGKVRFAGYESVNNPRAHATPASVWERVF